MCSSFVFSSGSLRWRRWRPLPDLCLLSSQPIQFPKCITHLCTLGPEQILSTWNVLACQPPSRVLLIQIYSFIPSPPLPLCFIYWRSVGCHGAVFGCLFSRVIQSIPSAEVGFRALRPVNRRTQPFSVAWELFCTDAVWLYTSDTRHLLGTGLQARPQPLCHSL